MVGPAPRPKAGLASAAVLALLLCVARSYAAELVVSDVRVSFEESDGTATPVATLASTRDMLAEPLALHPGRKLKVSFLVEAGGEPFRPQQAVLTASSGTLEAGFAAKHTKGGRMAVTVPLPALAKRLPPGPVALAVVVGDASTTPGAVRWQLGTATLPVDRAWDAVVEAAAALGPRPVITHQHRPPQRRANPLAPLIAIVGLGALLVAYVVLLHPALLSGLHGLTNPGRGRPLAAGFQAALAAALVTLVLFWLRLSLLQTLPALGGVAVMLNMAGGQLSKYTAVQAARQADPKKTN